MKMSVKEGTQLTPQNLNGSKDGNCSFCVTEKISENGHCSPEQCDPFQLGLKIIPIENQ